MLTRRPTSAIQLEWIRACVKDACVCEGCTSRPAAESECADGVRARRLRVCGRRAARASGRAVLDHLHHLRAFAAAWFHTDYNYTTARCCRCLNEASNSIWGLGCVPEVDGIAQLWAQAVSLSSVAPSGPQVRDALGAREACWDRTSDVVVVASSKSPLIAMSAFASSRTSHCFPSFNRS